MADIEFSPDEAAGRPALMKGGVSRLSAFAEASLTPLLVYCVTTALVVAGTLFSGTSLRTLGPPHSLSAWDGGVYAEIAQEGYRLPGSGAPSTLAFFPAYPLAGRAVSRVLNVHPETDPQRNPVFSLQFANPIYFMTAAALVAAGAWRRWLTPREVLLSVLLLGIPYATHSYRAVMMGHGRYAAVVFPAFIVLGRLLADAPRAVGVVVSMVCGFLLAAYAALFVAWRPLI